MFWVFIRQRWGIENKTGFYKLFVIRPNSPCVVTGTLVVIDRNPYQARPVMKRLSTLMLCLLTCVTVLPAHAHGGGGWHGGVGYGHHQWGGWRNDWVGPVLGAAVVGSVIYAANTPRYVVSPPVVVTPPVIYPNRIAYFCSTAQQYYPNVPTCNVPWQVVNY